MEPVFYKAYKVDAYRPDTTLPDVVAADENHILVKISPEDLKDCGAAMQHQITLELRASRVLVDFLRARVNQLQRQLHATETNVLQSHIDNLSIPR